MNMIQFLGEWIVRSSFLILTGALVLWLLRVKNPSVRLTAWTALLIGSLAIPVITSALPKVPLRIMRPQPAPVTTTIVRPEVVLLGATPSNGTSNSTRDVPKHFDWMRFTIVLYTLVGVALLLRLFAGFVLSLRILRQSCATGIGHNGSEARESAHVVSPVTVGVLRPTILLPLDWRQWDSTKLDAVLAHERSHIRRRDPAIQFISVIHRSLLWISPLSWFLDRRIVRTAELISDDDAIVVAQDRASYAEILLEFVQRSAGRNHHSFGVPMARYDRPDKRIRRILNSATIPSAVTHWGIAAILGFAASALYLAAAASPQSAAAQDKPKPVALMEFEVASIKPVQPNDPHGSGLKVYRGGRVAIHTASLKGLISTAFGVSYWQISGGDEWVGKDYYNVEANPSESMRSSIKDFRYTLFGIEDEHLREMLQALLIDRFQLKFHRETKSGDVYLLKRNGKTLALRSVADASTGEGWERSES
ncbi:MAG TPA: M56 family metallopeptidase, partial [Terriglobia bacterium]|nr:M56 family metallopeptidase [Terriglobia bacterium]